MNVIRSIPAVTTRRPQWRMAAIAAASSQIFITMPPCTKPAELASWTPIQRISSERESATGRGSGAPVTRSWCVLVVVVVVVDGRGRRARRTSCELSVEAADATAESRPG